MGLIKKLKGRVPEPPATGIDFAVSCGAALFHAALRESSVVQGELLVDVPAKVFARDPRPKAIIGRQPQALAGDDYSARVDSRSAGWPGTRLHERDQDRAWAAAAPSAGNLHLFINENGKSIFTESMFAAFGVCRRCCRLSPSRHCFEGTRAQRFAMVRGRRAMVRAQGPAVGRRRQGACPRKEGRRVAIHEGAG